MVAGPKKPVPPKMSILKGFLAVEELRHPAIVKSIASANAMAAARRKRNVIDAMIPPNEDEVRMYRSTVNYIR
jgi:hypothetical protein